MFLLAASLVATVFFHIRSRLHAMWLRDQKKIGAWSSILRNKSLLPCRIKWHSGSCKPLFRKRNGCGHVRFVMPYIGALMRPGWSRRMLSGNATNLMKIDVIETQLWLKCEANQIIPNQCLWLYDVIWFRLVIWVISSLCFEFSIACTMYVFAISSGTIPPHNDPPMPKSLVLNSPSVTGKSPSNMPFLMEKNPTPLKNGEKSWTE